MGASHDGSRRQRAKSPVSHRRLLGAHVSNAPEGLAPISSLPHSSLPLPLRYYHCVSVRRGERLEGPQCMLCAPPTSPRRAPFCSPPEPPGPAQPPRSVAGERIDIQRCAAPGTASWVRQSHVQDPGVSEVRRWRACWLAPVSCARRNACGRCSRPRSTGGCRLPVCGRHGPAAGSQVAPSTPRPHRAAMIAVSVVASRCADAAVLWGKREEGEVPPWPTPSI